MRRRTQFSKATCKETDLVSESKSFCNRIRHLHEAVVSAAQHGLRLLDRIDLARPRLTAHVEVLQEEVARAVELRNVPPERHECSAQLMPVKSA